MNVDGMERFEEMCRTYLNGSEEVKNIILSFLSEDERKMFLEGCGFYHLFTDESFYKSACENVGKQVYSYFDKQAIG